MISPNVFSGGYEKYYSYFFPGIVHGVWMEIFLGSECTAMKPLFCRKKNKSSI